MARWHGSKACSLAPGRIRVGYAGVPRLRLAMATETTDWKHLRGRDPEFECQDSWSHIPRAEVP